MLVSFQKPDTQWNVANIYVEPGGNSITVLCAACRRLAVGTTHQHPAMVPGQGTTHQWW